jgi:xanthine dehydrogenase accessory factor
MPVQEPTTITNDIDVIRQSLDWVDEGLGTALATVIETWGSAPRPIGSQVVINSNSDFTGSVSGGCIEGEVVTEAHSVIRNQTAKILEFQVSDETATGAGLACGGKVRVLVSPVTDVTYNMLKKIEPITAGKDAALLYFNLETGIPELRSDADNDTNRKIIQSGKSQLVDETDTRQVFVRVYTPKRRLLINGAVHIAQSLAILGKQADFDVTIVDPRTSWATPERFPNIDIDKRWPSTALGDLSPDKETAVVMLTHDAKLDDPAFMIALKSDAFYIGALGSRKTHAKRVTRLKDAGLTDKEIERIHAPIGLDIKAGTPFEIAVSIIGEIIETYRRR